MSILSKFFRFILRICVRQKPLNQDVMGQCLTEIEKSRVKIRMELENLKRKFSYTRMVEAICVTDHEIQKIEQALKIISQGDGKRGRKGGAKDGKWI